MNKEICTAIDRREIIRFNYDGGIREVEPHCYGVSRAGNDVLRAYQIGGYSSSGNPVGWRLFEVSKMHDLQTTSDTFEQNRPGYNPNDSQMTSIYCHV